MQVSQYIFLLFFLLFTETGVGRGWADDHLRGTAESSPSKDLARVMGKVWIAENYQKRRPLPVFKNRDFCGPSVPDETLLLSHEGGVRNAVVMLRPLDRAVKTQPRRVVLDNKQCAFVPHVQVATLGSELVLKNSDPILHAVHARLGKETLFNVGLPRWRQVTKTLGRAGVIRIDCDVLHTWMSAAVIVTTTPYYAVTDEGGWFTIVGLPVGSYEVEIWHERLGTRSTRILLTDGITVALDIVYAVK
jgi:hypothetical protein